MANSFRRLVVSGVLTILNPAIAATAAEPVLCFGTDPEWKLGIRETLADLTCKSIACFDIPHFTTAENRDCPKAYTLVASNASAIVVLDRDTRVADGKTYPLSVDILIQMMPPQLSSVNAVKARKIEPIAAP